MSGILFFNFASCEQLISEGMFICLFVYLFIYLFILSMYVCESYITFNVLNEIQSIGINILTFI